MREAPYVNFVANTCPGNKYLTRFMAAHAKHRKVARRKREPPLPRRGRPHKPTSASRLQQAEALSQPDAFQKAEKASRIKALLKGANLKLGELNAAKPATQGGDQEEIHGPRGRERSA